LQRTLISLKVKIVKKKTVKVIYKLTTGRQCGQDLAFDIHQGLLEPLCLLTILGMEFLL